MIQCAFCQEAHSTSQHGRWCELWETIRVSWTGCWIFGFHMDLTDRVSDVLRLLAASAQGISKALKPPWLISSDRDEDKYSPHHERRKRGTEMHLIRLSVCLYSKWQRSKDTTFTSSKPQRATVKMDINHTHIGKSQSIATCFDKTAHAESHTPRSYLNEQDGWQSFGNVLS